MRTDQIWLLKPLKDQNLLYTYILYIIKVIFIIMLFINKCNYGNKKH